VKRELVASFYYERKLLSKVGVYERNESLLRRGWPLRRYGQEMDQDIRDLAKNFPLSPTKTRSERSTMKRAKVVDDTESNMT